MAKVLLATLGAILGAVAGIFVGGFTGKWLNASPGNVVWVMLGSIAGCAFLGAWVSSFVADRKQVPVPLPLLGAIAGFCLAGLVALDVNPNLFNLVLILLAGTSCGLAVGALVPPSRA